MRTLFYSLALVVLASSAQAAPLPTPWNPPIAGQWVDGTWSRFHQMLCNQVEVNVKRLGSAYVDMRGTMGTNPKKCEGSAVDFAIAGGALESLRVLALQFEASSTSLNPVDAERIKFHNVNWSDDTAVHNAAVIDCTASTPEAYALFDTRFADVRKTLGDMAAVCGVDLNTFIASRLQEVRHDVDTTPAPGPTPQTVNVTSGCAQAGTLPSLLVLGVALRRRRRANR